MRKLTKFFIAVVLLGAYACTTDTTGDLGVNHEQDLTTITISLEESRTQLGEEADGIYPLTWSEGDQISVNGLPSNALTANEAGKRGAVFTVPGLTAEEYAIAYPAADEGKVLFAENQVHAGNSTFGSGVSTMYGTCKVGEQVTLSHLTGVLKIGVTGEATLTQAQISTIDRAPIAGEFEFDFDNGFATATDKSAVVINYSFGEGLQLTGDVQYLHVAVPAGEYGELYVTLYDSEGGVMYATVKADINKPLVAGNIRTFKNDIAYAATDKVVVINNYADLKALATKINETTKNVVFTNDIVIPEGETWSPIEGGGFSGTVLGNGYAIKGLNAPLFNTTSASFKGLHLEGVNIVETANPNVGAFARAIIATDTVEPAIQNCSTEGKIQVNCTGFVLPEGGNTLTSFAIGGLVGHIQGVNISNCTNNIAIDVDQVVEISNATNIYESIAGIVGVVAAYTKSDSTVTLSNLSNLENLATIDVHTPKCTASSVSDNYRNTIVAYVAGVAGRFRADNKECTVENITNRGNITITGWYGQGLAADDESVSYTDIDSCLAGVFGHIESTNVSNINNHGKVSFPSGYGRFHYIGGVIGISGGGAKLSDINNYGMVDLPTTTTTTTDENGEETTTTVRATLASLHCAGVLAHSVAGGSLSNGNNHGKVSVKCGTVGGGKHRYFRVGGIVAFADGSVTGCNNHQQIACDVSIGRSGEWRDICVGGVVAYKESDPIKNSENNAHLYVKINSLAGADLSGTDKARDPKRISIGGVVGLSAQPCDNVTNNGTVETWGSHQMLVLGGVAGDMNYSGTKEVGVYNNNGKVYVRGGTTLNLYSYIGGCVGYSKGEIKDATNGENASVVLGDSESKVITCKQYNYIGGIVGFANSTSAPIKTANNYGKISIYANSSVGRLYVAGISPYMYGGGTSLTNHATGDISYNVTAAAHTYVSGIGGFVHANCSNLLNQGDIAINTLGEEGLINALTMVSGVFTNADCDNITFTSVKNEGNITVDGTFSGDTRFSGLQSDTNFIQTWDSCYNTGNITISKNSSFSNTLRVAGLLAYTRAAGKTNTLKKCYNTGNITINSGATITNNTYVGGIIAQAANYTPTVDTYVYNTGNISVLHTAAAAKDLYVGGAVGYTAVEIDSMQSVCEVVALPAKGGVGVITGTKRGSTALVNGCKLGGKLAKALKENGEPDFYDVVEIMPEPEYEADGTPIPMEGQFIAFYDAIYGSWSGASAENCDNCSYISEIVIE
jgi:hypothetical protein